MRQGQKTPRGEKQAARQRTVTQSNITHMGRKTTDQHRTTDTRKLNRQTRVMRETQVEQLKQLFGSLCELQDCSLRDQSPGEHEECPRERTPGQIGASAGEAPRSAHSAGVLKKRSRALTVHAPPPNRQHKECVYPLPLRLGQGITHILKACHCLLAISVLYVK